MEKPEKDKFCESHFIIDGKLTQCERLSNYRVTKLSPQEELGDDGKYHAVRTEIYLCTEHYEKEYKYGNHVSGSWTFRKIKQEPTE